MSLRERFERRISEASVARILDLIAAAPNRRPAPAEGDRRGTFDFWFGGGAAKYQTGYVEYLFSDDTKAQVGAPISVLCVSIEFSDGSRVRVQQQSWGREPPG